MPPRGGGGGVGRLVVKVRLTNPGTPFIHHGHALRSLMHDSAPSGFVQQLKLGIGDEAIDLDDGVRVRVKASHLTGRI